MSKSAGKKKKRRNFGSSSGSGSRRASKPSVQYSDSFLSLVDHSPYKRYLIDLQNGNYQEDAILDLEKKMFAVHALTDAEQDLLQDLLSQPTRTQEQWNTVLDMLSGCSVFSPFPLEINIYNMNNNNIKNNKNNNINNLDIDLLEEYYLLCEGKLMSFATVSEAIHFTKKYIPSFGASFGISSIPYHDYCDLAAKHGIDAFIAYKDSAQDSHNPLRNLLYIAETDTVSAVAVLDTARS